MEDDMSTGILRSVGIGCATAGLLVSSMVGAASAAGPQPLPAAACQTATAIASQNAPNRTSSEAIPHVEHTYPVPVPYCHHFNPTATPPAGP